MIYQYFTYVDEYLGLLLAFSFFSLQKRKFGLEKQVSISIRYVTARYLTYNQITIQIYVREHVRAVLSIFNSASLAPSVLSSFIAYFYPGALVEGGIW